MNGYQLVSETIKKPIHKIVKDPAWQKVRESLIGQWKERPEWCIRQLRAYIGPFSKTSDDKLRIVMNYLTGSGFRTGRIKHSDIQKLRDAISIERKRRKIEV